MCAIFLCLDCTQSILGCQALFFFKKNKQTYMVHNAGNQQCYCRIKYADLCSPFYRMSSLAVAASALMHGILKLIAKIKIPENSMFSGKIVLCNIRFAYRFENCGARRAALRPYSPDLDPKRPVFMRFFGLSSLSKPIGKPTKSRNFWCSLTQPECSIHNAA